jgi:predicted nucleic acid-binding Zn ribbon protein
MTLGKREAAVIDNEVCIATAGDIIEAEIIEGLLKSHNIPSARKFRDNTEWIALIAGNTRSGIDIYVPSIFYDKAKEILDAELIEEYYEEAIAARKDRDEGIVQAQPIDNDNVIDKKEISELLSEINTHRKIHNLKYYGVILLILIIVFLAYAIGDLIR